MQALTPSALTHLRADELTARLYEIRKQERRLLVEFLSYLGELDRRKLYLELSFPSLFAFCTDFLGLTKASAFRRTTAARLLSRFPVIGAYLADGRLCLTTLVELRDVLSDENDVQILDRAAGKSEEAVKALVASLRPRPEPTDLLRSLPAPGPSATSSGPVPTCAPASVPAAPSPPPRPASLIPVADERLVLRVTVSRAFADDLKLVKDALGHKIPDGSLEKVLHECLRVTLAACTRRRRGAGTGRGAPRKPPHDDASRYIPAAVRDEVWRRDEGRCTFVGSTGRRCDSTHLIEIHHVVPFARGGLPVAASLTLHCAAHNRYCAEKDFGADKVARAVKRAPRQGSLFD